MALASTNLPNYVVHETISASDQYYHEEGPTSYLIDVGDGSNGPHFNGLDWSNGHETLHRLNSIMGRFESSELIDGRLNSSLSTPGRKKRRRRRRVCKDKDEAEAQRMTHIFVERNRRKLMNEHLAVLRSLMPDSYAQRGDQASIVGGAINFVKELEHLLQSLEAQKRILQEQRCNKDMPHDNNNNKSNTSSSNNNLDVHPFKQFFGYPQCTWCQGLGMQQSKKGPSVADIEVTMTEAHANLRILSNKRPKQLTKMILGFQALLLTILHLSVTSSEPFVFYSISARVEEGCHLKSVDEIAGAVHHMLTLMEEEAALG